jgi:hypothetical protein
MEVHIVVVCIVAHSVFMELKLSTNVVFKDSGVLGCATVVDE